MPTKIYWIHQLDHNSARIGTMARPRGNEWLEDEVISLKKQKTDVIISLLEKDEVTELGLRREEALCQQHGIEFFNFPIADRALPPKGIKTDNFIKDVFNKAASGLNIVIHCRMGIGRASIIAGSILLYAGLKTENIIAKITEVRGLKVPDTDEQLKWLKARE